MATKLTRSSLSLKLDKIYDEAHRQIYELAERYRTDTLLPLCSKKKLTFWVFNDDYYFARDHVKIRYADDAQKEGLLCLLPVLHILMTGAKFDRVFGSYLRSIHESEWVCYQSNPAKTHTS